MNNYFQRKLDAGLRNICRISLINLALSFNQNLKQLTSKQNIFWMVFLIWGKMKLDAQGNKVEDDFVFLKFI